MHFDTAAPWGAYAPDRLERALLRLSRSLPRAGGPGAALAMLIRRPLKYGRATPLDVRLWGLRLRLARRDSLSEARMLFTPRLFDPGERRALRDRLSPGDVFVDLGANAGGYSFWVYAQFGGAVRVLAIEPDPALAARIRFNAATNRAAAIEVIETAVGDTTGTALLAIGARNRGQNRIAGGAAAGAAGAAPASGHAVQVPIRPLLDVLQAAGVTGRRFVLKIDIEGLEHRVLAHFFAHAPPALRPAAILAEVRQSRRSAEDAGLIGLLEGQGYRVARRFGLNIVAEARAHEART